MPARADQGEGGLCPLCTSGLEDHVGFGFLLPWLLVVILGQLVSFPQDLSF